MLLKPEESETRCDKADVKATATRRHSVHAFPEYVIRIGWLSDNVKVVCCGMSDPKGGAVADVDPCDIVSIRNDPETLKSKHDLHPDSALLLFVLEQGYN
jgi:hypothetical protein